MGTCDSVIKNRCRMQERRVFGGISSTACLEQSNILDDTRPEARKRSRRKTCADFCDVGPKEGAFDQFLSFIRGGSAPRSNPLPFYIPFFRKGTPFVYLLMEKGTPFIYLLKKTYE